MKKLSLDALVVESFETHAVPFFAAGTVRAHGAGTDASNCATCDTCQGPNCQGCGCRDSTAA